MPYWPHMKKWLEYTERVSYLMSQGHHVCDIAILYPTETLQAFSPDKPYDDQYNFSYIMELSNAGLDYDLLKQALTGAIIPDGYPFTISASFLGAIDKTYLTGKLANTYADKVHTHLWANITDRPTALPANGGNADTVDNLHASSFAQIKSYTYPDGGINNITDLDFTGNIQAHFPGHEYSCIWQGKDFRGVIFQLKLKDYYTQSMMYRGGETKTWRTVWDSGNFNPENYLPLSGGSITGGLGVSGYLTAGVLRVKATSYPQISFVNTTTNRDSLLFVNGSELYWRPTAGTATDYQVYHSGNFNPDSKLGVSSVAVEAKKMSYQGLMTAISGTTTFPAGLYLYGVYSNGYPVTYGNLLRVGGSGLVTEPSLHSDLAISTGLVDSLAHSAPPVIVQRIFPH